MTKHTSGTWTLGAGRTITTPDGEFYLGYGKESGSNRPKFQDFAKLDEIARQVVAIPDLLEALERLQNIGDTAYSILYREYPEEAERFKQDSLKARAAIAKAKGE